jgi:tryptophan halogenase
MDSQAPKTRIIIVGGGTSGWMTATALSAVLPHQTDITLVESAEIGIIGVGEATLPHIRNFNERVGIDEAAFMKATHATFKLGIEFVDWGAKGRSYIHPFGDFGVKFDSLAFYHHWLQAGMPDDIESWSLPILAARQNRFAESNHPWSNLA